MVKWSSLILWMMTSGGRSRGDQVLIALCKLCMVNIRLQDRQLPEKLIGTHKKYTFTLSLKLVVLKTKHSDVHFQNPESVQQILHLPLI